jgi:hypothetical protein
MLLMIHEPFAPWRICGVTEQTNDRRIAERLHAILLLNSGQHVDATETG